MPAKGQVGSSSVRQTASCHCRRQAVRRPYLPRPTLSPEKNAPVHALIQSPEQDHKASPGSDEKTGDSERGATLPNVTQIIRHRLQGLSGLRNCALNHSLKRKGNAQEKTQPAASLVLAHFWGLSAAPSVRKRQDRHSVGQAPRMEKCPAS